MPKRYGREFRRAICALAALAAAGSASRCGVLGNLDALCFPAFRPASIFAWRFHRWRVPGETPDSP